jgi:hypothetical protein
VLVGSCLMGELLFLASFLCILLLLVNHITFQSNWPSSGVQVACLWNLFCFSVVNCLRLFLCWYHAIAMYVFSLSLINDRIY